MVNSILAAFDPMVLIWGAALLVFLIAEGVTAGIVSIWFAGGALISLILAAAGVSLWIQIVAFLVVSVLLLLSIRPFVKKFVIPGKNATNADRNIGKQAIVLEEINNLKETGTVKLSGVIWSARAEGDEIIPAGTVITVTRIQGVKVWVTPAKVPVQV